MAFEIQRHAGIDQDANEGVPTSERLFTLGSNEYEIASYSSYKGIMASAIRKEDTVSRKNDIFNIAGYWYW